MAEELPTPSRTRTLAIWLVVGLMLAGSVLILKGMSAARQRKPVASATPPPVVTVSVTKPTYQILPDELIATGTVRAVEPLSIGSEVNGLRIVSVNVEEGSRVRKGQPLAVLNSSLLEAQLSSARARYQGSLSQISKAAQPNRPQDISGVRAALAQSSAAVAQEQANLRQARTNLEHARRTASRYSSVLQQGFVTAQEAQERATEVARQQDLVRAAEERVRAAEFAREQARQRLSLAEVGGRAEDVAIAQASSQEAAAAIQLLEAQLEQTVIRAPEDGIVVQRDAHVGDIVSTGKVLFSIARLGELELRAQIPESDLLRIKTGDLAQVSTGGSSETVAGGIQVRGRVWMISPQVDPTTRLGTARIMLDTQGERVLPGMFARARLKLGTHRALVVPAAAVLGSNDNYFVFVDEAGHAKQVSVIPGVRSKDKVEIRSGLKPDSRVIVKGAGFLSDGDRIAVQEP